MKKKIFPAKAKHAIFCPLEKCKNLTNFPLAETPPNAMHVRFWSIAKFCVCVMEIITGHFLTNSLVDHVKLQRSQIHQKCKVEILNYINSLHNKRIFFSRGRLAQRKNVRFIKICSNRMGFDSAYARNFSSAIKKFALMFNFDSSKNVTDSSAIHEANTVANFLWVKS